jgi:hypothetical protein
MLWSRQRCPRRDEHIEVCASFDGEPDVIETRAALVESFARMLRVLIEADHQAGRLVEQDGHRPLRKVDLSLRRSPRTRSYQPALTSTSDTDRSRCPIPTNPAVPCCSRFLSCV